METAIFAETLQEPRTSTDETYTRRNVSDIRHWN